MTVSSGFGLKSRNRNEFRSEKGVPVRGAREVRRRSGGRNRIAQPVDSVRGLSHSMLGSTPSERISSIQPVRVGKCR